MEDPTSEHEQSKQELTEKLLVDEEGGDIVRIDERPPWASTAGLFAPPTSSNDDGGFGFSTQPLTETTTATSGGGGGHGGDNGNRHLHVRASAGAGSATTTPTPTEPGEKQPDRYRDAGAAIVFLAHLLVVAYFGLVRGLPKVQFEAPKYGGTETLHFGGLFLVFLLACAAALGWTALLVAVLTRFGNHLVQVALWFTLGTNAVLVVLFAIRGYWTGFALSLFFLGWTALYARSVWRRLPLCAALLQTALAAVQANFGIALVAYGMVFLLCLYTILWILAGIGVYVGSAYCQDGTCSYHFHAAVAFAFLLSYAWTANVLTNVLHATVSGVVATWYFTPDEASQFWSPAIVDSLTRASTYSFGSLCLGSLLTAIVQAAYHLVRTVRQHSHRMAFVGCAAQCLLGFLERLVTYFHRYALVYVAVYGYDYLTAGQKTAALFASRGWTAIINDDLVARVLGLTSCVVGAGTGALVLLLYNPAWIQDYYSGQDDSSSSSSSYGLCFFLSLVLGTAVANLILSIVSSATDTVLVAFAEAPVDLERNHPGLHRQLVEAWRLIYPDEFAAESETV